MNKELVLKFIKDIKECREKDNYTDKQIVDLIISCEKCNLSLKHFVDCWKDEV